MNKIKDIINNLSNVAPAAWTRLALLVLSMLNLVLRSCGVDTVPVGSEVISSALSIVFAVVSALAAYWKNNSFTSAAQAADKALRGFRESGQQTENITN